MTNMRQRTPKNSPPDTAAEIMAKPTGRSRITNGSTLVAGVDGRSTWARRMKDLIQLHVSDLGGEAAISAAEKSIVRRVAALTVELEHLEARFARDGAANAADLDLYQRVANSLRRLLESIGLQRRARDVTIDLRSYIAEASKPESDGGKT